jgi:hypothetical protein
MNRVHYEAGGPQGDLKVFNLSRHCVGEHLTDSSKTCFERLLRSPGLILTLAKGKILVARTIDAPGSCRDLPRAAAMVKQHAAPEPS